MYISSSAKIYSVRSQMMELFSSHLSSLGSSAYGQLIDSFMNGNVNPLADALSNHEKIKAQQDIKKQFSTSSITDIALALDDPHHAALKRIANEESSRLLREQKVVKDKLESGFVRINLGKNKEPVNLEGQCFWVPASVRHDVRRDDTTGLTRYSFFVYGGVSVQPRINVVRGGNGALGGNRVGGGQLGRAANLRSQGFQNHHIISRSNQTTKNHELLQRAGFNNINSRANMIFLPKNESLHPTRTIHNGRHTQNSMDQVSRNMNIIVNRGKAEGWNQAQYRSALNAMLSNYRQELRAGNIALNKNHRPWAR